MSWAQFNFNCRYYLNLLNQGSTLQQAKQSLECSSLAKLYGEQSLSGIQQSLLDKVFHLSSIKDAQRTLNLYASIDFAGCLALSGAAKDLVAKLSYLASISIFFAAFITLYQVYVFPVFADLAAQYPALKSDSFELLPSAWVAGLIVALSTLVMSIALKHQIKNIDRAVVNSPNRIAILLLPKRILATASKLQQIIATPSVQGRRAETTDKFDAQLNELAQLRHDESAELALLFEYHAQQLTLTLHDYANRAHQLLYGAVVLGIGFYIVQIYDPIFKLGEVIQ
ncbi:hypothetical protein DXX93_02145 [Thalassotalea euphylliae]|uniref:Type II secretion system protein GspF domain-containing protein n=1 Tax=Thalassotalea euphylliae TaxID=1655234 RepID=A0A3E0TLT1_9GAMM|nr:hypothetical protein [Thalassotalea euphylliae]REL25468.1 hypothetical protein DXX93_02145 [Thalassotalea euphylliae]